MRSNYILGTLFLTFFLLQGLMVNAQNPFLPQWQKGDTLEYFITESDLIESERVSLETYTVRLYVRDINPQRSILEAHLYLPTPANRGPHWEKFFKLLQDVPFTYFLENGVSNTFQNAVQLEATMHALDQILITLVDEENLQPIDFAEISQWMNQLKPRTELPYVLEGYFQPLNKVFDHYGQVLRPMDQLAFTDLVNDCGDSSVAINWIIDGNVVFNGPDTMHMTKRLLVSPNNDPSIYQALANCEKLDGLEAMIQIDGYSNIQTEAWMILINQGRIPSYKYDKVITMRFQELETSRTKQTRIIMLK